MRIKRLPPEQEMMAYIAVFAMLLITFVVVAIAVLSLTGSF